MPDHPKDDSIDWKALKRQSQRPASLQPPALQPALEFLQDDLAPMISRLAELAADLLSKAGVLEHTRTGASKLAQRLGRLAGLLARQSKQDWTDAADNFLGRHHKAGWNRTCLRVASNDNFVSMAALVGDRLQDASTALLAFAEADSPATAAHQARASAKALLAAATTWNQIVGEPPPGSLPHMG